MTRALRFPDLEHWVARVVYADVRRDEEAWKDELGWAMEALDPLIQTRKIPRKLVVQRMHHALTPFCGVEEAAEYADCFAPALIPGQASRVVQTSRPQGPRDERPASTACDLLVDVCSFTGPRDNLPMPERKVWGEVARDLTRFALSPTKDGALLWSPVRYRDGATRSKAGVLHVSCVVLDYDDGTHWDAVLPAFEGHAYALHTSYSHTAEHPKWRLALPLAAPVPAHAWGRVWHWAVERAGKPPDPQCKDPSRIFYVPTLRSIDALRHARVQKGKPLAVPQAVLEGRTARGSAWGTVARKARVQRALAGETSRGDLYKVSEDARRELATALGARVYGGTHAKDIPCPGCGKRSVHFWIPTGGQQQARCNHRQTCGWAGWLDQLEEAHGHG